jgi:DNA-binding MarR family transcriptional regulator
VVRQADPSDRRAVLVVLTPVGRQALEQLRAEYRALLHEEMEALDDGAVEILARAVEILDELVGRLTDRE